MAGKNDPQIDIATQDKAADGDAAAIFELSRSYKAALEALPDEIKDQEQNRILQENRLLLANEFYKTLKDSAQSGLKEAKEYVQELTHQNQIPLKRYDGKLFRGMAELSRAGDHDAHNVAKSISKGLNRALLKKIEGLQFPGSLSGEPKKIARNLLHTKNDEDCDEIAIVIKKSLKVFETSAEKSSANKELSEHYNTQATALKEIDTGLEIYKNMLKTLKEIDHQRSEPS